MTTKAKPNLEDMLAACGARGCGVVHVYDSIRGGVRVQHGSCEVFVADDRVEFFGAWLDEAHRLERRNWCPANSEP